jgi:hypothetical protein
MHTCTHTGGENAVEAIEICGQNSEVLFYVLCYVVSIALYNVCSLNVAKNLSTVHRTLIGEGWLCACLGVQYAYA